MKNKFFNSGNNFQNLKYKKLIKLNLFYRFFNKPFDLQYHLDEDDIERKSIQKTRVLSGVNLNLIKWKITQTKTNNFLSRHLFRFTNLIFNFYLKLTSKE